MTKILVTGATGWLGKRLVQALVDKNHTVFAFARTAPKISPFPTGAYFSPNNVI
jgi:nucleoside-diphosphate-sugar epimerase